MSSSKNQLGGSRSSAILLNTSLLSVSTTTKKLKLTNLASAKKTLTGQVTREIKITETNTPAKATTTTAHSMMSHDDKSGDNIVRSGGRMNAVLYKSKNKLGE